MLGKPEKTRNGFMFFQLLIVLLYNTFIIIIFPYKVPVEFSTLSYFVVPFIVLFNIKDLKLWAAFSALLSGGGYFLSMVVNGNGLYSHFPVYSVATSLFNHGSLLAFAVITLLTYDIKKNDKYILLGGVLFNITWATLIRPFVLHPGRIFILEILDASIVRMYYPGSLYIGIPVYFVIAFSLLFLSIKIVYVTNNLYKNKVILKK